MENAPDKLDETLTIRLPSDLKILFRKLPIEKKHEVEHRIRLVIARACHDAKFNPHDYYLGDE